MLKSNKNDDVVLKKKKVTFSNYVIIHEYPKYINEPLPAPIDYVSTYQPPSSLFAFF